MTYFNAGDVDEALEAAFDSDDMWDSYYDDFWSHIAYEWDDNEKRELTVNDDVKVTVQVTEVSTGTYDDDTYIILKVTEEDGNVRHFRKFGWTASHDGTYWEGSFDECYPEEKTITVWRTVR